MVDLNGKRIQGMPAFSEINKPYSNAPAYIAHYVNQSEETYRNRKGLLPKDDTGGFRQITDTDINNLHNQYNDIDNLEPKTRYADNIKKFLEHYN